MFKLLRYFSIASLIAFIIVTVLLGYFYRQTAMADLIKLEESKNVALTQAFANSLWPEFQHHIANMRGLEPAQMRAHPDVARLRKTVVAQMAGLSVLKIKVYNMAGITVFSTQIDQIGEVENGNGGYRAAAAGTVISELTHRDTFSAFEGEIEDQNVLATYIPIRPSGANGRIEGVLELYSNVTPLLQQTDVVQRNIILGVGLILATLYGILFLIVQRADRIMHDQQQARIATEHELRSQQRAMATLKERERLARELHDGLGQVLGYVKMQAQVACELLAQGRQARTTALLRGMIDTVQLAHVDVRESIMNLQTGAAAEEPFIPMLQAYLVQFEQLSDIQTIVELADDHHCLHFEPATKAQLIRIVQEALTNVRKHANAQQVTVRLASDVDNVYIAVQDNGRGFEPGRTQPHLGHHVGLGIMQDRAREIGGDVQIKSLPGQGATVTITIPLYTLHCHK